jgi:small neutral amino acid transporter SnatA (MarC family)
VLLVWDPFVALLLVLLVPSALPQLVGPGSIGAPVPVVCVT